MAIFCSFAEKLLCILFSLLPMDLSAMCHGKSFGELMICLGDKHIFVDAV